MAEVQGIGGVFLYSNQAATLANWYTDILGIHFERHPDGTDRFYKVFFTRDSESSVMRENPVFAINQAENPIRSGGPTYMLNLRVDNLDDFIRTLQAKEIEVEPDVLVWERGKHAWIQDPDGNRIELYEEIFV
jgi:catechol 2,3-dioxygenase-like lactoylglutathione lyase family enzyme